MNGFLAGALGFLIGKGAGSSRGSTSSTPYIPPAPPDPAVCTFCGARNEWEIKTITLQNTEQNAPNPTKPSTAFAMGAKAVIQKSCKVCGKYGGDYFKY